MAKKFLKPSTLLIILMFISACVNSNAPVMQDFRVKYHPQLLISMKWGLNPDEMPPYVLRLNSSDLGCCGGKNGEIIRRRPHFLQYIGDDGHFYVLTVPYILGPFITIFPSFDLLEFTPNGTLQNRFHLRSSDTLIYNYRVSSFIVKDRYIYLYESINNDGQESIERVRKIALEGNGGKDVWQTRIDAAFTLQDENTRDEMYIDMDDHLYLFSWSDRIIQLDIHAGEVIKDFFLNKSIGSDVFLSPSGRLYADAGYGVYTPYVSCTAQTGKCVAVPNKDSTDQEALLGVDEKDKLYVVSYYGDRTFRIISSAGETLTEFPFPDVIAKNTDEIYFGFWNADAQTMLVRRWGENGQAVQDVQLSVPGKPVKDVVPLATLIQVNQDGYFVFQDTSLYQYSLDGKLIKSQLIKEKEGSRYEYIYSEALFDFESVWTNVGVDRQGRIYLTIADPEGFKVVRLDLVLPEEEAK